MRILLHGINYSPELTGIGKYTGEMAEWLANHDHEVRVITAPPYYPQWQIGEGYLNRWVKEKSDSLLIYRCPLWIPLKPSGLKRLIHLASFTISSFPVMMAQIFWRPDVVWVVEPALFCAPQAWLVARLSGGKAWLHIQDYELDAAFDLGLLKGSTLRNLVANAERLLMRRFDKVSTISQRMADRALSKGVDSDCVELFPNWVDLSGFAFNTDPLSNHSNAYRTELGINQDSIVALYSGNMGNKQGLEILAQVAHLCPDVTFVFCGHGAGRVGLMKLCEGLHNVLFLDLQPLERLGEFLAIADIHLLPQRADAADLVMPSKLTGMFASGRPVIATAQMGTELADVVSDCGLVVESENPDAFAEAINLLAHDKHLRKSLGSAGRIYAELYMSKNNVLATFKAALQLLIQQD